LFRFFTGLLLSLLLSLCFLSSLFFRFLLCGFFFGLTFSLSLFRFFSGLLLSLLLSLCFLSSLFFRFLLCGFFGRTFSLRLFRFFSSLLLSFLLRLCFCFLSISVLFSRSFLFLFDSRIRVNIQFLTREDEVVRDAVQAHQRTVTHAELARHAADRIAGLDCICVGVCINCRRLIGFNFLAVVSLRFLYSFRLFSFDGFFGRLDFNSRFFLFNFSISCRFKRLSRCLHLRY